MKLSQCLWVWVWGVFSLSACTLDPPGRTPSLSIEVLPDRAKPAGTGSTGGLANASAESFASVSAPSSISDFDCLAVNVLGPGIPSRIQLPVDPRILHERLLARTSYCSYSGIVAGPLSSSAASGVNLVVPAGPARVVQIIGIDDVAGGTACTTGFGAGGAESAANYYEIGRAVIDLNLDSSLTIQPEWAGLPQFARDFRKVNCLPAIALQDMLLVSKPPGLVNTPANFVSGKAAVSGNGRWVAFESTSTNIGSTDTNQKILLKDLETGGVSVASSNTNGVVLDGTSQFPVITPDGRYVVFLSDATNFVGGPASAVHRVYRKDTVTGTLEIVSLLSDGNVVTSASTAEEASVSPDGRFVTFVHSTTDPLASGSQIYLRDMTLIPPASGAVKLASSNHLNAAVGLGLIERPQVSQDGIYVTYAATCSACSAGAHANEQVYRKNMVSGAVEVVSSSAVGVASDGATNNSPSMSSSGRFIAFASNGNNLMAGVTSTIQHAWLKDMDTGALQLLSRVGATHGNGTTAPIRLSGDGSRYVFQTNATNLGGFILRGQVGSPGVLGIVAADRNGVPGKRGGTTGPLTSKEPAISQGGQYFVFSSEADNLVIYSTAPTSGNYQIYRKYMP